jgi:uncharacterized protein (TIGR02118 family)
LERLLFLLRRELRQELDAFNRDVERAGEAIARRTDVGFIALYLQNDETLRVRRLGLPQSRTFDALMEIDSSDPRATAGELAGLRGAIYRVEQRRVKREGGGVFLIALVHRAAGLDASEFDSHWRDRHAPLALRHHVGMTEYRQNVVREILGEGSPAIDGVAELGFPSREAFELGFIDSEAGGRIIADDLARFTDTSRGEVVIARELVLRP